MITLAAEQPRPRDAQATRQALLKAAQRRFGILGYDRTTTRDVADDAGVNLALINRYFGGKEGLFQAVLAAAPELLDQTPLEGDLAEQFLASLEPEAWPEFGHHPLLLLLRHSHADEKTQELRQHAMRTTLDRLIAWSSMDASANRRQAEIRAQLVHALFSGIVALRYMTPSDPLATASVEELLPALQDAVTALLGPPASD